MTAAAMTVRALLAVGVVLLACRGVGWLVRQFGQPRLIGELVAGILLGPSVLGLVLPSARGYLFPQPVIQALGVVAQLGLVLFMLLVGLEATTPGTDGTQATRIAVLATASISVPLLFASGLAIGIHPMYGGNATTAAFVLFVGAAMSVTALPVLARLLRETGLGGTRVGATALVCAAVNDVVAWVLVAIATSLAHATGVTSFLVTAGGAVLLILALLLGIRPLLSRYGPPPLWAAVVAALVSAWAAEQTGIHAIFGAFVAGVAMPRDPQWRRQLHERLDPVVTTVLLPVFFVVVGLSTRVDQLRAGDVALLAVVLVLAVVTKVGGVGLAARARGDRWRQAFTLGLLMNARGVTEIVVLSVGLQMGLIGSRLFTVLVLVAVGTTFMTVPLLRLTREPEEVSTPVPPPPASARSTRLG